MSLGRPGNEHRGRLTTIQPLLGKGAWTLSDQLLSSGTNFLVAIVLARALGPRGFGAYAVAFAVWVVVMTANRSLLVQPFVVEAASLEDRAWDESASRAATGCALLGCVAALPVGGASFFIGASSPTGGALAALAVCLPLLCLQDFWRFAGFSRSDPRSAAFNDAVWGVVQMVALAALWQASAITPTSGVAAWGLGAAVAGLFGFSQHHIRFSPLRPTSLWVVGAFRPGKWFALSSAAHNGAQQGTVFLVAGALGPTSVGGLRAALNIMAPLQLLGMSVEALGLPAVSRAAVASHGFVRTCLIYSGALTTAAVLYSLSVVPFSDLVISSVFGSEFGSFSPLVLPLSVGFVAGAVGIGASLGLRATLQGKRLVLAQAASAPMTLLLVITSMPRFGVIGAAWSMTAGYVLNSALLWALLLRGPTRGAGPVSPSLGR